MLRKGAVKGKQGQTEHVFSEDLAENVELYAMWGLHRDQIAGLCGISHGTVDKYYREQMVLGRSKGIKVATGKLFTKILDGNLAATIFYLKCKGGFQERQAHQLVDGDGEPIDLSHVTLGDISDELLGSLKRFLHAALAGGGEGDAGQSGSGGSEAGEG